MKKQNNGSRPLVSILMLCGFLTIVVTGIMSYSFRYNQLLSAVHTVFGLLFVFYGIFHLRNNLRPLGSYLKKNEMRKWVWSSVLIIPVVIISLGLGVPPAQWLVDAGYALKELRPIDRQRSSTIYTKLTQTGQKLSIDIKAGEHYSGPGAVIMGVTTTAVPQMAMWVESFEGEYLETLYVTKKASNSSYIGSIFGGEEVRRPEALPHWSHSRGVVSEDGLLMPSSAQPLADALTGATPLTSFDLRTVTSTKLERIVVKLEINRSFDFNDFYHEKAYPDDPIYSGSGNSAQPSLVYSVAIDLSSKQPYYFLSLVGRGHHSGRDGDIHTDLSGISTAKQMIARAIVEVL